MNPKDTPDLEEQKPLTLEMSYDVLKFYFDAALPEVGEATRAGMAAAIMRGVHQHQNALLRELEGKVEAMKRAQLNVPMTIGATRPWPPVNEVEARNSAVEEFKQILADARVGE